MHRSLAYKSAARLFCKEYFLEDPSSVKTACICVTLMFKDGANYFTILEPSLRSSMFQDRILVLSSIEISRGSEISTMKTIKRLLRQMSSVESGNRCAMIPSSHRNQIMNRKLDQ